MVLYVGVPCGIAVQLVLDGKLSTPGILTPYSKEIYDPVREVFEAQGMGLNEKVLSVAEYAILTQFAGGGGRVAWIGGRFGVCLGETGELPVREVDQRVRCTLCHPIAVSTPNHLYRRSTTAELRTFRYTEARVASYICMEPSSMSESILHGCDVKKTMSASDHRGEDSGRGDCGGVD